MSVRQGSGEAVRRRTARISDQLAAAVAMLTRVPVAGSGRESTGAAAYGLIGALVGGLGGIAMLALGATVPTLAAIAAVGMMAIVSGALHLDGLADTTDALLASDAARAEMARKDPAIGAGGAVALVLVLAAQVAALASLAGLAGGTGPIVAALACVVAGAASRTIPVGVVLLRGDAISRHGLGAWFAERVGGLDAVGSVLTTTVVIGVAAVLVGAVAFAAGAAVGAGIGVLVGAALVRERGQLDGDVLGATVELGFAATVGALAVAMAVTWPSP